MTRYLLAICLLFLPSISSAQGKGYQYQKHADGSEELQVEVNGVRLGVRYGSKGEVWTLHHERNPITLGLTKRMHAHREGPFQRELDPREVPASAHAETARDVPVASADTPVTIDILITYTDAVATAQGGVSKMPAFAALNCALWNQTAINSGAGYIQARCLGPVRVSYQETSTADPLSWMYPGIQVGTVIPNGITETTQLQDQYGADLAVMLVTNTACGVSYIHGTRQYSTSVVNAGCSVSNKTFPHETGHVVGMQHDLPNAGATPQVPYEYGYCYLRSDGTKNGHRDVLTYPGPCGGDRTSNWSNPDINDADGTPTGTATANNALVLKNRAATMAAWRTAVVPTGHPPSKFMNFRIVQ
jgi:hypothetical protein